MNHALGFDTKITLLAAGPDLPARPGPLRREVATNHDRRRPSRPSLRRHRPPGALLYSFATLLLAVFVGLSAWPAWANLTAAVAGPLL
jgi:hypothetical protein